MRLLTSAIGLLVMLGGSGGQAEGQRTELLRLAERMLEDIRSRNVEAVISHYDAGPDFVHIENGVLRTWRELEAQMREFIPSMRQNNLRWIGTPTVVVISPDSAVIYGRHSFSGIDAAGKALPEHQGFWTGVMRRTGGRWKIAHSHSSDPPSGKH